MKPTTPEVLKSDFLMRLYFSNQLDSAKIKQFLKEEISRKQSQLDDLESQLESWQNNGMTDMQKVTFDYGVIYYSSTLKFLKELLYQSDI